VKPYSPVDIPPTFRRKNTSGLKRKVNKQRTSKEKTTSTAQLQAALEYFFFFTLTKLSMLELCQQFLKIPLMLAVKGDSPTPTLQSVRDKHCQ
jgi:hypothetical protein